MSFKPRIAVASVVGLAMVGGSFLLSQDKRVASGDHLTSVVREQPTREFVKVVDQDQDGLPDWQNSLDIPTINLDEESSSTEISDTAAFAVSLATRTSAGNSNTANILADLGTDLNRSMLDRQYSAEDITVSEDNSPFALRAYGNAVAKIVLDNAPPTNTENELTVLNRALLRDDESVLEGLNPTIASYEKMTEEMLKISVPSSIQREHLALTNVYQALVNDIKAFRGTFNDALPAMNRFRRYQADAEALYVAISALYLKLDQSGIKWTEADTASRFIKIE